MTTLTIDQLNSSLGWYGKLPAGGDFFQRRLPVQIVDFWQRWIDQELMQTKRNERAVRAFLHAPIWNFVTPATLIEGVLQLGCISPSRDRVGRLYPLLCCLYVPVGSYHDEMLLGSMRFYAGLGNAIRHAVSYGCNLEEFERQVSQVHLSMTAMLPRMSSSAIHSSGDIASILNEGHDEPPVEHISMPELGWRELNKVFDPYGANSFWWTSQATGAGFESFMHTGMPNRTLFNRLFN